MEYLCTNLLEFVVVFRWLVILEVVDYFTWLLRKHKCLLVSNAFRSSPRDLVMRINALPKGTSAPPWFWTRVAGLRNHCSTNWAIMPSLIILRSGNNNICLLLLRCDIPCMLVDALFWPEVLPASFHYTVIVTLVQELTGRVTMVVGSVPTLEEVTIHTS